MIDITNRNLVVMQDAKDFNGDWRIFENEKVAKQIMAMDNGTWNWIGYIFDGWEHIGTEAIENVDSLYSHYIHTYRDVKGKIKYISEIVCEPNELNKAKETFTICKVHSTRPTFPLLKVR